jgi:phenylalanyl-tRNA synthetase alpha subunit
MRPSRELEVEDDGRWFEVMAWGVFTDRIVRLMGGDPARHMLGGVGYGLERLAMLRYGIDDIRKVEIASVAEQRPLTSGTGCWPDADDRPVVCSR